MTIPLGTFAGAEGGFGILGSLHCDMQAATLICLVVGVSNGDTLTARCGQQSETSRSKSAWAALMYPSAGNLRNPSPEGPERAHIREDNRNVLQQDRPLSTARLQLLGRASLMRATIELSTGRDCMELTSGAVRPQRRAGMPASWTMTAYRSLWPGTGLANTEMMQKTL